MLSTLVLWHPLRFSFIKLLPIMGVILWACLGVVSVDKKSAYGQISIDINEGQVDPIPVVVPYPIYAASVNEQQRALFNKMIQVTRNDIANSGLLRLIPLQKINRATPSSEDFTQLFATGSEAIMTISARWSNQQMILTTSLWSVVTRSLIHSQIYSANTTNWRTAGHVIADDIYQQLTGDPPYFTSRVIFIAETGTAIQRDKRLAIMDQDGHGVQYLTSGEQLVLTPRFAPDGKQVAYLSIFNKRAAVYVFNLINGNYRQLGDFAGMTFAPRFTSDSRNLIMSHAESGNTELYLVSLNSNRTVRLTNHPAIDTSPSISPRGDEVAFTSDREGTAQIFILNLNSKKIQKISLGEGRYYTPVWSPRGDHIAFTKSSQGKFFIGVMSRDGSNERLLTSGYLVEGPDWSPNGRTIIYTKQASPQDDSALYTVDITGYFERKITTPTPASDPSWSQQSVVERR